MSNHREQTNRREMFRTSMRYLALGGIGLASAGLIDRTVRSSAGERCRRSLPCRQCDIMGDCTLPPALAAKNNLSDKNGKR